MPRISYVQYFQTSLHDDDDKYDLHNVPNYLDTPETALQ